MSKILDIVKSALPFGKKKRYSDDDELYEALESEDDKELAEFARRLDTESTPKAPVPQPQLPDYTHMPAQHGATPATPFVPQLNREQEGEQVGEQDAPAAPIFHIPKPKDDPLQEEIEDEADAAQPLNGAGGGIKERLQKFAFPLGKKKKEKQAQDAPKHKKKKAKKERQMPKVSGGKLAQVALLFILLGAFFGLAYFVLGGGTNTTATVEPETQKQTTDSGDKNTVLSDTDPVFRNPFVETAELNKAEVGPDGKPVLPSMGNPVKAKQSGGGSSYPQPRYSNSNGVLPAIPSNGAMPSFTPPAMPSASAPAGSGTAQPQRPQHRAEVSGVLTGEDGSNMAIMSDGTVVSQGETYGDGRIAYIGGDGIRFEDGTSIPYNNP